MYKGPRRRATITGFLSTRRRTLAAFAVWTAIGSVPALVSGWSVTTALDRGFLSGRVIAGVAWLIPMALAAVVGSVAARRISPLLGAVVEPLRDELVTGVAGSAVLRGTQQGRADHRVVAALVGHTDGVRDLTARLVGDGASVLAVAVAAVAGLATLDPLAAAIVAGPAVFALVALAALTPTLSARGMAAVEADEAMTQAAAEVVVSVRDVRACGAEDIVAKRAGDLLAARAAAARALARAVAVRTVIGTVGAQLPLLALLAAAPALIASERLSTGGVVGAIAYLTASLQPALTTVISLTTETWLQLQVLLRRLDSHLLAAHEPSGRAAPDDAGAPSTGENLVAEDLHFSYGPHATPIVAGLDLTVCAGEHIAVVGPSGIGKSTLADLLAGLTAPHAGRVTLGRARLTGPAHGRIALIPQEAYVFAGRLGENLRYLRPDASDDDLARAADEIGATGLVERLGGWDAQIDARNLSAGERQLIALARTWLAPADIVILDEATCHLDPTAEAVAERAFARRPGSLVVIAHRLSSARRADRILVMEGDRTCTGTHEQLLAESAIYRSLTGRWRRTPGRVILSTSY